MTETFLKITKLSGFLKGNFSYDGGGTIPKKPYSFKPFTKPMRGEQYRLSGYRDPSVQTDTHHVGWSLFVITALFMNMIILVLYNLYKLRCDEYNCLLVTLLPSPSFHNESEMVQRIITFAMRHISTHTLL